MNFVFLFIHDWALLMHLSSPFWSRQHSNGGSSACVQEGFAAFGCEVMVSLPQTAPGVPAARAAADRRCCKYLIVGRLW